MSAVEGPVKILVGKFEVLYYHNDTAIDLLDVRGHCPEVDEVLRGMGDTRRFVYEFDVFPGKRHLGIICWRSADDASRFDRLVLEDPQTRHPLDVNTLVGERVCYACKACGVLTDLVVPESPHGFNTLERHQAFTVPLVPCPKCGELFKGKILRVLGSRDVE